MAVIADCVKFDGSLSDLQSQQAGSKKLDSEVKPKENQNAFLERGMCVGVSAGQILLFPVAGTHGADMLVCHHLGHLAFPVFNLKHLFSPSVLSLQILFQREKTAPVYF